MTQLDLFADPSLPPPPPRDKVDGKYLVRGGNPGTCRSCGAPIYWITTASGAQMPLTTDPALTLVLEGEGTYAASHFADCPHARAHRKGRQ